jgi:hypothetical protein
MKPHTTASGSEEHHVRIDRSLGSLVVDGAKQPYEPVQRTNGLPVEGGGHWSPAAAPRGANWKPVLVAYASVEDGG